MRPAHKMLSRVSGRLQTRGPMELVKAFRSAVIGRSFTINKHPVVTFGSCLVMVGPKGEGY